MVVRRVSSALTMFHSSMRRRLMRPLMGAILSKEIDLGKIAGNPRSHLNGLQGLRLAGEILVLFDFPAYGQADPYLRQFRWRRRGHRTSATNEGGEPGQEKQ